MESAWNALSEGAPGRGSAPGVKQTVKRVPLAVQDNDFDGFAHNLIPTVHNIELYALGVDSLGLYLVDTVADVVQS